MSRTTQVLIRHNGPRPDEIEVERIDLDTGLVTGAITLERHQGCSICVGEDQQLRITGRTRLSPPRKQHDAD